LLLGKLHIWEVANWEIVTCEVALGRKAFVKVTNIAQGTHSYSHRLPAGEATTLGKMGFKNCKNGVKNCKNGVKRCKNWVENFKMGLKIVEMRLKIVNLKIVKIGLKTVKMG